MRTRSRTHRLASTATLSVLALAGLAGCGSGQPGPATPGAPLAAPSTVPVEMVSSKSSDAAAQLRIGMPSLSEAEAKKKLDGLKVAVPGSTSDYSRTKFPHWRDASTWGWPVAPSNSCNARNAALYRDGAKVTLSSTCTKLKGSWVDPYGGETLTSVSDVDIDHIVPLAEAWRSGAKDWTTEQRTAYANAPLVLVSADDSLNQSKGDKDPAAWKPPLKTSWCDYAKRWTLTKATYKMSVDAAEKSALTSMLSSC